VNLSFEARLQLGRAVRLRDEVKRAVFAVLDAALEVRRLCGGQVHRDAPLVLKVDGHLVTYSLDLDAGCATIISAEAIPDPAVRDAS